MLRADGFRHAKTDDSSAPTPPSGAKCGCNATGSTGPLSAGASFLLAVFMLAVRRGHRRPRGSMKGM